MGAICALATLLVLSVITVTRGQTQYFDTLKGLQQLFQPFLGYENISLFNGATSTPHKQTNRQESKKKTVVNRHRIEEKLTKLPPPMYQYDYVFATTEKPSRKTTESISSQNNNSSTFNSMNEQSNIFFGEYPYEIPTKVNRVKTTTTTEASYFNYDGNRETTQNVFSNNSNVARPVTENVNHKETFAVNNQPRPANVISNGASLDSNNNSASNTNNRPQNDLINTNNKGSQNIEKNPSLQENNRNDSFLNTDNNLGSNNFGDTGASFNNTETINNNSTRGNSNNNNNNSNKNSNNNSTHNSTNNSNNLNQGNNFGGFNYSDTPLINRPGVQPSPANVVLPPITNRPASNNNNFGDFNRPSDPSSVTSTDQPVQEPEVLIGPNEDDMTESQKKQYAEKAERMCDNYNSFAAKMALTRIPSPYPGETKVSACGPINVPLVIGGSVTSIREFPHMALVGWLKVDDTGYSWKCGGSLISDRYVLTAAHCTYHTADRNVDGPPRAVQLGSSYRNDREALVVKISAIIRHPKYKSPRAYHDVALIKMVSKVKFSEVIRPACLGVPPPTDRSITATGWGNTESHGDYNIQLRSISLSVWDMQECQEIWGKSRRLQDGVLPDSHMCAGDRGGWHDTCQGDSGGPVQIQDGCLWRVVAVTSLGRSCGSTDFPALYAVIPHAFVAAQVFDEVPLQ